MEVRVILDSPIPVYRQIVDAIRSYCVGGELRPGSKLPTVRELAAALGVHFNTVAEAYRVLAEEGWVAIEGRRGVTVLDRERPQAPGVEAAADEGKRIRNYVSELKAKGFGEDWIRSAVMAALEGTK